MTEPKKDCFAYVEAAGGTCNALKKLYCANEKCGFYKTKEQHAKERYKNKKGGMTY